MKKILFNDVCGLTAAVIDGRKTMKREIVPEHQIEDYYGWLADMSNMVFDGPVEFQSFEDAMISKARYKVGEIVAVAQAYKDAWVEWQNLWEKSNDPNNWHTPDAMLGDQADTTRGWSNKMFVKADLMPHQIYITNVKVERLQDISDEDCLKEGIIKHHRGSEEYSVFSFTNAPVIFGTAQAAFAALIRVNGKGTWKANPWVFVYSFELVK